MKKILLLYILLALSILTTAQKHDNFWLLGYEQDYVPGNSYGMNVFSFSDGAIKIEENNITGMEFYINNTSFSDSMGNLVAYFNGLQVENAAFQIMENGAAMDQVIEESSTNLQYYSSDVTPQGSLFLPYPGHPDSLFLIYCGEGFIPIPGLTSTNRNLSYALIDRKANNGLGKIIKREQSIIEDTISYGQATAVKHANGRDWWVLISEQDNNRYYRILIDPSGIQVLPQQDTITDNVYEGAGQSCFSPNGRYFAAYNAINSTIGASLDIFDFDRCAGYLSNQKHIKYSFTSSDGFGGIAFSPNSRFLYHNFYDTVYQYDMYATDFMASRQIVCIRDSFPFAKRFFLAQLAPDGKIYSSATNGSRWLHVMHDPDEAGIACNMQQRGYRLKVINTASVPNHPNYRLGPLDNSTCDTLGINNNPIAWYRYEQDTLDPLQVAFHDLSYYEPASWVWDFGDGTAGSTERHPQHQFDTTGVYEVCLTVSNVNSSNTHCKTLYLGVSATANPVLQAQIQVDPNPFSTQLNVALSTQLRSPTFLLYDLAGRLVRMVPLDMGINTIETTNLAAGLYFYEVRSAGRMVKRGKIVRG